MVAALPSVRSTIDSNNATTNKMNAVLNAMRSYQDANASLPCPADASLPIGSNYYGVAVGNPGPTGNCSGATPGTAPAANYTDTTNNVAIGMVPVRTLGLSNDYALDSYGRDITYAVDTNATVCFAGSLTGAVKIMDNNALASSIAALISHGADGHGAWLPFTGSSGTAVRLNAGSTDTDEQVVNAHGNSIATGGFPTNYSTINSLVTSAESTTIPTTFVRKPSTPTFDDLVVYRNNLWTLDTQPQMTSTLFPVMTSPTPPSGSPGVGKYYTGNVINFVMTFPQAVTVNTTNGTPSIQVAMQSSFKTTPTTYVYATYASGSGTTALTFSYPVKSTDYSLSTIPNPGISVATPIATNGGTINYTSTGLPACLAYTPPNLSGILVNPIAVFVVDSYSACLVKEYVGGVLQFSSGAYSGGTYCGYGTGQLDYPEFMAFDMFGNFYVTSQYNTKVMYFNGTTGAYISSMSTYGSTETPGQPVQFSSPAGIAYALNSIITITAGATSGQDSITVNGITFTAAATMTNTTFVASPSSASITATNIAQALNASGDYPAITFSSDGTGNIYAAYSSTTNEPSITVTITKGSGGTFAESWEATNYTAGGGIWVADAGSGLIIGIQTSGIVNSSFGGTGTGTGQFTSPSGITFYGGYLWIVDRGASGNGRVQKCTTGGSCTVLGLGQFTYPNGNVVFDSAGNMYVTSGGTATILKYSTGGVWSNYTSGYTMGKITGLAIDPQGNLWAADNGNSNVVEFNSAGVYQTSISGFTNPIGIAASR